MYGINGWTGYYKYMHADTTEHDPTIEKDIGRPQNVR